MIIDIIFRNFVSWNGYLGNWNIMILMILSLVVVVVVFTTTIIISMLYITIPKNKYY